MKKQCRRQISAVFFIISLLVTVSLLGFATAAAAVEAHFYVDPVNGDDDLNDGRSPGTAWRTLHHALAPMAGIAVSGELPPYVLNLAAGVYKASGAGGDELDDIAFISSTIHNNLTIQGDPAGGTTVDGNGAASWLFG
ncbi:MAG: hypothetical protein V1742_07370, partial [Pseudomonadota bacterium]